MLVCLAPFTRRSATYNLRMQDEVEYSSVAATIAKMGGGECACGWLKRLSVVEKFPLVSRLLFFFAGFFGYGWVCCLAWQLLLCIHI